MIPLLKKEGFRLFRKTYIETLSIEWLIKKTEHETVSFSAKPLKEVLRESAKAFFNALKKNYETTHLDNPAAELTWQKWQAHVLKDAPDLNLSSVSEEGYILLHPISKIHYQMGWVGGVDLQSLLRWQLIKLQQQGVKTIEIEVDTTDKSLMELFSFLNFEKIKAWHSYKL